ncbi:putative ribonuclease H-like domain-containing protein [Tanacetum coccineum]
MTHPHPKRNFVPRAVLMKYGLKTLNTAGQNSSRAAVSVNTARSVNTAYPRPTVNCARPTSNVFNRSLSHVRRPFNKFTTNKNSNFNERVNTVKGNVTTVRPKAVVSDNKGNEANAVKASTCWVWRPKQKVLDHEKGVIDSGCSRHMTGNISCLSDYEEIDGGYVAFGEDPKRRSLKFIFYAYLQMCGKKNNVLFTDTECVVLSSDFKLLDESQVLLTVSRKDIMYSVDLRNGVPQRGLTCLFAKATLDESNLSHRRLGHNKEMNQFYKMKRIKREFSVAKTPQPNEVAKRKNRTLIEAARTMLADSKLPTTFWAEAVNTACKFDGKADEGFFVGYSMNSKAFRVFNSIIRIVKENLYITFSENKPNVAGSGPEWLFDIDTLTKSMNYKPVVKDAKALENEDCEVLNTEEPRVNQEKDENVNSINNINTVSSTVNTASIEDNAIDENIVYGCADDLNMPNLEEINYSNDDEGVGAEADINNLDTFMPVSPILTTRIHKDHPIKQIIGDIHSAPQTRRLTKNVTKHDMFSLVQQGINHKDFQNCLFACFLSQAEPKKQVLTLVDLPYGKRAIESKWIYRNKKDERGIVVRNKARLVAQGFEDPKFPDRVYKVEKALYCLHQAPSACEDKYVDEILKKFGFSTVKTASTPIETSKPLMKDENVKYYLRMPHISRNKQDFINFKYTP